MTNTNTKWFTLAALVAAGAGLLALRKVKVRKPKAKKESKLFI